MSVPFVDAVAIIVPFWFTATHQMAFWCALMVTGAEDTWCSVVARSTICRLPNLYPGNTMNSECTSGTAAASRIGLTSHSPLGLSLVDMEKSFLGRWGKLNTVMWSLQTAA